MMSLTSSGQCLFTFSSINNSFAGTYTVTIHAYDYNSNTSEHGTESFNLVIESNESPDNLTVVLDKTVTARYGLNLTLPPNIFTEPEGEEMTYGYSVFPSTSLINIDTTSLSFLNISETSTNADAKVYTVTLTAIDGHPDTVQAVSSFKITINSNGSPHSSIVIPDQTVTARYGLNYTIQPNLFTEPESEPMTFGYSISPNTSIISIDPTNLSYMNISDSSTNLDAGVYTITLTADDDHADTNPGTNIFKVTINPNKSPKNETTVSDMTIIARYGLNHTLPAILFSEPESEPMTYDYSISPNTSLITVDTTSLAFMNISSSSTNSDAQEYTVTLTAEDGVPDTAPGVIIFKVTINPNEGPQKGSTVDNQTVIARYGLNYSLPSNLFNEPESEVMTYGYSVSPSTSLITVDTTSLAFVNISSSSTNSDVRNYTVTLTADDPYSDTTQGTNTFIVLIDTNQGPSKGSTIDNQTVIARYGLNYTLPANLFNEPESEAMTYGYSVSPNTSLITVDTTSLAYMNISSASTNADFGNYTVTLTANDPYSDTSQGINSFKVTINKNQGPTNGSIVDNQTVKARYGLNVTFPANIFSEPESEDMIYGFTVSPTTSLFTVDTTNLSYMNISDSSTNSDVGEYTITLTANDQFPDTTQATSSFKVTINANQDPENSTTIFVPNQSVRARFGLNYTFPSNLFHEPDSETLIYGFTVSPLTSLITVDTVNLIYMNVSDASTNLDAGVYNVTLTADDGHHDTAQAISSFNVTIIGNLAPIVNETLTNELFVAERPLSYTHTEYAFEEPEGETIYLDGSFSPSASFLTYDNTTRTFSGTPSSADTGTFIFTLTGYDGHSDTGNVTQTMNIEIEASYPPTTTEVIPDVTLIALYDLDIDWDEALFNDLNNDIINFQILHNFTGSWVTVDNTGVQISGTPPNSDFGNYAVKLRAYDDFGKETNYTVNIQILENFYPVATQASFSYSIFSFHSWEQDLLAIFSESNGEALTWSLSDIGTTLNDWVVLNSTTNKVEGTPAYTTTEYDESVKVTATDPKGLSTDVILNFNIKVNGPPILTTVGTIEVH